MIFCNYRFDNVKSYLCRADCPVLCCVLVGVLTFYLAVLVYFANHKHDMNTTERTIKSRK